MPSTNLPKNKLNTGLIEALQVEFPHIKFVETDMFAWSPETNSVHFNPSLEHANELLLHELSHGLLEHRSYKRDIELLAMEAAAWAEAQELATAHNLIVTDAVIQDNLDTYRDWLHARSTCPACTATGYQIDPTSYECPACQHRWRVNEARSCALRRYGVTTQTK